MKTPQQRADLLLVARGFFDSRARAQAAIAAGLVRAAGKPVTKASALLDADAALTASAPHPYVSRGGVKLAAALDRFGYDPRGQVCLDIGASTGGFSEVLVLRGAARVYAVDVGHGQLHPRLQANQLITSMEGRDARSLAASDFAAPPELIVIDASFISLKLLLPSVLALAASRAQCIALIKPQFEAGRAAVRKGIVRDATVHDDICKDIERTIEALGWRVSGVMPSPIDGGDGNREFLIGASR
jgi:23S rRNA (cytidine1920-2'-O)/16S rRNA (cytidine1409-2'-O)-methyltransferase